MMIPIDNEPSIISHLCSLFFVLPYIIAITTPQKTPMQPIKFKRPITSFKKTIFNKTVKGAANANNMLFLRGPIRCKAINNKVSPKKIPITPDINITV